MRHTSEGQCSPQDASSTSPPQASSDHPPHGSSASDRSSAHHGTDGSTQPGLDVAFSKSLFQALSSSRWMAMMMGGRGVRSQSTGRGQFNESIFRETSQSTHFFLGMYNTHTRIMYRVEYFTYKIHADTTTPLPVVYVFMTIFLN